MKINCNDCPRNCNVDRSIAKGFCGESDKIRVSKIIENFMWEEPSISGDKGALAIFFSGCNLRCEFCQNYEISHIGKGKEYTPSEFRDLLLSFDLEKYSSIDLITPTHFSSLILEALHNVKFTIPIVWNSSAYEKPETIKRLSFIVDVFLPDFKYYDKNLSLALSKAEDYFDVAKEAILAMKEYKKKNIFENGLLKEGLLIRHLVLPGYSQDSKKILDFIADNINDPYISLMGQFTPTRGRLKDRLKPLEYKIVLSYAEKRGLINGFFQELNSANSSFIPKF